MEVLDIRDLKLTIQRNQDVYHILRGVNMSLSRDGALGIVGESGSGKTLTCLTVMRLLPKGSRIAGGQILFEGSDLLGLREEQMAGVRGRKICMVFQDARAALNPVLTVGDQIADIYCHRSGRPRSDGWRRAIEVLDAMGIPQARHRVKSYPHELSGGMCQRVMIAMALVSSPEVLIADEVTTGLDVTIQAQVIDLIKAVTAELGASLILVSHDIGVIVEACTEIAVMYSGVVLEQGSVDEVMANPCSPYTAALLDCFRLGDKQRMSFIPGTSPDLRIFSESCPFAERCPKVRDICGRQMPPMRRVGPRQRAACHWLEDLESV